MAEQLAAEGLVELTQLIRNASPDYPILAVEIVKAMRANPEVVLRALGGNRLDLTHGPVWSFPKDKA